MITTIQQEKNNKLLDAVDDNDLEAVINALKLGSDPNGGNIFLLCITKACDHEDYRITQVLLEAGADINRLSQNGSTPLIGAVELGSIKTVKFLLDAGADTEIKNNQGKTALMCACQWGSDKMIRFLLERGANINTSNKDGDTALYEAIHFGRSDIAELFINAGADMNARDKYGNTPLIYGAICGNIKAISVLVQAGADAGAKDKGGHTFTEVLKKAHPEEYDRWLKKETLRHEDSISPGHTTCEPDFNI